MTLKNLNISTAECIIKYYNEYNILSYFLIVAGLYMYNPLADAVGPAEVPLNFSSLVLTNH